LATHLTMWLSVSLLAVLSDLSLSGLLFLMVVRVVVAAAVVVVVTVVVQVAVVIVLPVVVVRVVGLHLGLNAE